MRVKVFEDAEEVDEFFIAWPEKCFRRASGVKYGGRFLIMRRDMAPFVAMRSRGKKEKNEGKNCEKFSRKDRLTGA